MNAQTVTPMSRYRLKRGLAAWALVISVVLLMTAGALWQAGFDALLWGQVLWCGGTCAVAGLLLLASLRFASREPMQQAEWRFRRTFFLGMVGQAVAITVVGAVDNLSLTTWAMTLIALLPVVPTVWVAFGLWRLMREGDELERRLQLESVFITCGVVGLLAFAGGMLQMADVIHLDDGLYYVMPAMVIVYCAAYSWRRRQYGMRGCV